MPLILLLCHRVGCQRKNHGVISKIDSSAASSTDLLEEATATTNRVFKKIYFKSPFLITQFVKFFTYSKEQAGMPLDCGGFCQTWLLAIKEKRYSN